MQLKLRQAGGAQLPARCSGGTFVITAPGQPTLSGNLGQNGQINVQLTVGVTYTITVTINCGALGQLTGTTIITVPPGGATGEIVITVSRVLGLSCSPSTVGPGETSTCRCDTQNAGPANITWSGVTASGPTAAFSSKNPGAYPISCAINGVDTRSTTVTVELPAPPPPPPPPPLPPPPPAQTVIVIHNQDDVLDLRAIFSNGPQAVPEISSLRPGQSASRNVQPGTYNVAIQFNNDGFLLCTREPITVNANQTQTRGYTFPASSRPLFGC